MKLDYHKTALIIVDVQYDFMPGGSLPINVSNSASFSKDPAHLQSLHIRNYTTQVIDFAKILKSRGCLIVSTRDWHPIDHSSFKIVGGIWPIHCVQNSRGSDYANEEFTSIIDLEVLKGVSHRGNGYSGFGDLLDTNVSLALELNKRGIQNILVCGVATDYCVKSTAADGAKVTNNRITNLQKRLEVVQEGLRLARKDSVVDLSKDQSSKLWDKVQEIKEDFTGEKVFKNVFVISDLVHGVAPDTCQTSIEEMSNVGVVMLPSFEFLELKEKLREQ
ncbi:Cysteine hydrolase [Nowakowskiella sp. JEL0407]|nr:Cysteine hydrolase [Nowakowskiella sp. JEL0407]